MENIDQMTSLFKTLYSPFYFADLVSKGVSQAGPADQICKVEFDGLPNRGQADKAFGDIDGDGNSENSERKEPFAYLHRGP